MRRSCILGLLALWSLLPAGLAQGPTEPPRPDYRNPALPTARRVEDLLSRMTLEEKVAQMLCIWKAKRQITDAQGASTRPVRRNGSGSGSGGSSAQATATGHGRRRNSPTRSSGG